MSTSPPFIRSPYNYDQAEASLETGLACLDPSLCVASDAIDADINTIVRRFGVTGEWPQTARLPTYDDFSHVVDYQTAQQALMAAQEGFAALPAHVRAAFNNDPQQLLEASQAPDFAEVFQKTFGEQPPAPPADKAPEGGAGPLPT